MGQTPFYQTSNELKCVHLWVNETETPISWLQTNIHCTSDLVGPNYLDLLNHLSKRLKRLFSNIAGIRACSSFDNKTRSPYFWLRTS